MANREVDVDLRFTQVSAAC